MTLFRKVMKTTFHYESFLEFYSAHFGIKIEPCFIKKNLTKKYKKIFFIKHEKKFFTQNFFSFIFFTQKFFFIIFYTQKFF